MAAVTTEAGGGGAYEGTGVIEMASGEDLVTLAGTRTTVEVFAYPTNTVELEVNYGSPAPARTAKNNLGVPAGGSRVIHSFSGAQVRITGASGCKYRVTAW